MARYVGKVPSIILTNPKYGHNVGAVVRAASNFDIAQVWYTGTRVQMELKEKKRLPREERMRGYQEVELINFDYPLEFIPDAVPVVIELLPGTIPLYEFDHPANAVYIFGPEDGTVNKAWRSLAHHFVHIPSRHCLNLAAAVNVVLYDRAVKGWFMGGPMPELSESRAWNDAVLHGVEDD